MRRICIMCGLTTASVVLTASVALAGSPSGTWVGKPRIVQEPSIPASAYPPVRVVVSASTLTVHVTGRTSAAHDGDAISTCDQRYRFKQARDGWRFYAQSGAPRISGAVSGGAPEYSFCGQPTGCVIRIRAAGTKLKLEYTTVVSADEPFVPVVRAYLTH